MPLEERMRAALLRDAGVAAACGGRMAEGHKPQGGAYPQVTFKRTSTPFSYVQEGRLSIYWARMSFLCWDKTPDGARTVAAAIIAALPTFDLTQAPQEPEPVLTVSSNKVLNQLADEWPDPEPTIYRAILDVKIWFTE